MTRPRQPDPARRRLAVSVTARGFGRALPRGLGAWLERAAPSSARGSVDVALVSDRDMRRMNAHFRNVDAATDVLSFPSGADGDSLGDVAIAVGVARRQAAGQGHSLATELRILALHGLLHLLGYDHEEDNGRMRRLEERLRRRAGLPRGLIARAPRSTTHA
jgi:probable rRNA maturation factor